MQIIVINIDREILHTNKLKKHMGGCNYDDGFVLEILLLRDTEHCKLLLFVRYTALDRTVSCKASDGRQL